MQNKIFASFSSLKANQKKAVVLLAVAAVMTVIGLAGYVSSLSSANKQEAVTRVAEAKNPVNMETGLLTTSALQDARKGEQMAKEALAEEKKRAEAAAKAAADGLAPPPQPAGALPASSAPTALPAVPQKPAKQGKSLPPLPQPLPPPSSQMGQNIPPPMPMPSAAPVVETEIGRISHTTNAQKAEDKADKKKDETRTVYLPISYMEATLLSGLDAPTSSEGKSHPVPAIIRVKTPAVLPNDVKANLRGCFVVGDAKGNLGTERAEMILATLSCIDRKGQAVINQDIVGYVVDGDGKAGLRGRVVTKMGAVLLRTMMAGMFSGFGEALNTANTTSTLTAVGTTQQSVKADQVAMAGLGKGTANAFKELEKFYLDLAHQTLPVIEIGAARPITLVITKGVSLEIKKIRGGR